MRCRLLCADFTTQSFKGRNDHHQNNSSTLKLKHQTVTFADDIKGSPHNSILRPIFKPKAITSKAMPSLIPRRILKRNIDKDGKLSRAALCFSDVFFSRTITIAMILAHCMAKEKKRTTLKPPRTSQFPEIPRRIQPFQIPTCRSPTDHESDDEKPEMTADDKIVAVCRLPLQLLSSLRSWFCLQVLNRIQEVDSLRCFSLNRLICPAST